MAEQIAPGAWWLHGARGSNVYLVEAGDGRLALIDAGFGSGAAAVVAISKAVELHLLKERVAADKIRRSRVGAKTLWAFLKLVTCLGNTAHALRTVNVDFSISSAYRIWKRFVFSQSHIRTALVKFSAAPHLPHASRPTEQTLAHLQSAFPGDPCPITAFQSQLQISFL